MRGPKHVGEFSTETHPGQVWQFFDDREVKTFNIKKNSSLLNSIFKAMLKTQFLIILPTVY